MRASLAICCAAMALAACSNKGSETVAEAAATARAEGKKADVIPCAVNDEKPQDCLREIAGGPDGPIWIIRRADGSFRRFVIIDRGRRIAAADGAQEVRTRRGDGFLEVIIGGEYYRFPDGDAPAG